MMKLKFMLVSTLLALVLGPAHAQNVVVIGHEGVSKLNTTTVQRVFTGKVIEVEGVHVTAVNLKSGVLRDRFLQRYLNQDDDKYTAYWTVRRFIGKGIPPRELSSSAEVIDFVQNTPGAIGYIDESEVKPGLNVVSR
jgi:ABC-type phosphate transport system substrate-binding protein